jgi:hypothetical protein
MFSSKYFLKLDDYHLGAKFEVFKKVYRKYTPSFEAL